MRDGDRMRVSDADRERAMQLLLRAIGAGRLALDEFSGRADRVLAAATQGEVAEVLDDLPGDPEFSEPPPLVLRTTSGRLRQRGDWTVPRQIDLQCGVGGVFLDFTEASCRHAEVQVHAHIRQAGRVIMTVPSGWAVRVEELVTTTGSVINRITDPYQSGSPLLRISGDIGSGRIRLRHPRRRAAVR